MTYRIGCVPTPPVTANRRHAWIIPTLDVLFRNKLQQLALAHHGIRKVQSSKFNLPGMKNPQRSAKPIVQRPMVLELQGADRMRNPFDRIGLAMGPIVHRVNTPLRASTMVMGIHDAIEHRISQIEIWRAHVYLGPKRSSPFNELAIFHSLK